MTYPQLWFVGAVDYVTNRVAMELCTSRSSDVLIPIIQSTCYPGSTIWSDKWKAYSSLKNYGFNYSFVNHSVNYVDPITGVNTNKIEGNWSALKLFLRQHNVKNRDWVESYVHEWCFRMNIGYTYQKCWDAIMI